MSGSLGDLLRRFTTARVALGRHGASLPTHPQLALQLAHAMARDAVHTALDAAALRAALTAPPPPPPQSAAPLSPGLPKQPEYPPQRPPQQQPLPQAPAGAAGGDGQRCLIVHSAAATREVYLQRPDLGRQLSAESRETLLALPRAEYDLAFVIADGLSALAIQQHAAPFLSTLRPRLQAANFTIAPLAIALQARVAIGDEIGELLQAKTVVVLIGERPGLSSPDSMGIYMTWSPRRGLTDEARNCISNVRPAGLSYEAAAYKLHYLLDQARKRQLSGVQLKDETGAPPEALSRKRNFLVL
jgi:ethanolamine ammonia-lyase small subunit